VCDVTDCAFVKVGKSVPLHWIAVKRHRNRWNTYFLLLHAMWTENAKWPYC